jgi:hypothetical protein
MPKEDAHVWKFGSYNTAKCSPNRANQQFKLARDSLGRRGGIEQRSDASPTSPKATFEDNELRKSRSPIHIPTLPDLQDDQMTSTYKQNYSPMSQRKVDPRQNEKRTKAVFQNGKWVTMAI